MYSEGNHIRLKASDARSMMTLKQENFNKTLGIIRQMCDNLIRETSQSGKTTFIEYEVPKTVFGCDSFDQGTMGKALAKELYEDGYDVKGTAKKLKISWGDPDDQTDYLPVSVHSAIPSFSAPPPQQRKQQQRGKKVEVSLSQIR